MPEALHETKRVELQKKENILLITDTPIVSDLNLTWIHYHSQTNTASVIDLTLCSKDTKLDFKQFFVQYLCDSAPCPVHIDLVKNIFPMWIHTLHAKKADWGNYEKLTAVNAVIMPEIEKAAEMIVSTIQNGDWTEHPKLNKKHKNASKTMMERRLW